MLVACQFGKAQNSMTAAQLSLQGEQLRKQGETQAAVAKQQEALQYVDENFDPGVRGIVLNNLGLAYKDQGKYPEALQAFEAALSLHRQVDDPKARLEEGKTLDNMGVVYQHLGQYPQALEKHQAAATLLEKVGSSPVDTGIALGNLGVVHRKMGNYQKALAAYQKALAIAQAANDRQNQFTTLNNIGVVYSQLKDASKALEAYQKSLDVAKASKNRLGEAWALTNIAVEYRDLPEQRSQALDMLKQALTIAKDLDARPEQATALVEMAQIFKLQNQTEPAISSYRQAIDIIESIRQEVGQVSQEQAVSYTKTVSGVYEQFAELLNQEGRASEAEAVLGLLKKS